MTAASDVDDPTLALETRITELETILLQVAKEAHTHHVVPRSWRDCPRGLCQAVQQAFRYDLAPHLPNDPPRPAPREPAASARPHTPVRRPPDPDPPRLGDLLSEQYPTT